MSGIERSRVVGMSDRDLDEFTCGICRDIFNDPVVTLCCRQTYCRICIEEWVVAQNNCPNDRKTLTLNDLMAAPRLVLNLLNNMNVKCDYASEGCQDVITLGVLPNHLISCNKNPESVCEICGFLKHMADDHNCIDYLVVKINSIMDEMYRIERENDTLKELTQSQVLQSARIAINEFHMEGPTDRIDATIRNFLIEKCQEAILNTHSFATISDHLYSVINEQLIDKNDKPWHVFVFGSEGGESMVKSHHYLRIRFDKLIIELFTSHNQNRQIVETSKSNQATQTFQVNPPIEVPKARRRVSTPIRLYKDERVRDGKGDKWGNPHLKIQWFSRIKWFFNIPSKVETEDSYGIQSTEESSSHKTVKLVNYKTLF